MRERRHRLAVDQCQLGILAPDLISQDFGNRSQIFATTSGSSRVLHMAMKSTVVIVAVSLVVAILLAAALVIAIERRGELSIWPFAEGPAIQVEFRLLAFRVADPERPRTIDPSVSAAHQI